MLERDTVKTPVRSQYRIIGKPTPRHDAWDKVLGKTKYADDFEMPGMLYAQVKRSEHPAANLVSVDTSAAEKLPGVAAVLTAKDVPNNETLTTFGQTHKVGGFEGLYRVLADKKIRYEGEAIALVAAKTLAIAKEAVKLIKVEYEKLEGVFDPLEARKPGAYLVGEADNNTVCSYKVRKGDIDEGFAKADVVLEHTYRVPAVEHAYLEPDSGVAWVDEDDVITIRSSTQVIEHFRDVAEVMGMPHNKVRVIAPMVGGGFGSKEDVTTETYLALLAWKTKKPVKLTYTREEALLATSNRHPYTMFYKVGADKDGKLVALEAELVQDAGAYVFLSPWVLMYSTVTAAGPYDVTHVKIDTVSVLTNNGFGSANRGFGVPQPCFAVESLLDELAQKLNMTPLALRQKNFLHTGDAMVTGRVLEHAVETQQTAEKAMAALGEPTEPWAPHIKIGQGFASGMQSYGRMTFLHDTSRSWVGIELDGSVSVRCGVQDIGCGQCSSLASIASEVLGVPMDRINVFFGDTALTPIAGTTTATRMLYMSGNATLKAARAVADTLLGKASEILGITPDRLELRDERVYIKDAECKISYGGDRGHIFASEICVDGNKDRYLNLDLVVRACAADGLPLFDLAQFNAPARELMDFKTGQGQVFADFTFGSQAMEVGVDTETGKTHVLKMVTCYDVGQAINSLSCEGQMEGGAVYGLGYGQTEEMIFRDGYLKTDSFHEFLIPTTMDVPDIDTHMVMSGGGVGPFGAKGIGEPACMCAAPAFSNAVSNAIGVRFYSIPLTPEKVLNSISKKA